MGHQVRNEGRNKVDTMLRLSFNGGSEEKDYGERQREGQAWRSTVMQTRK